MGAFEPLYEMGYACVTGLAADIGNGRVTLTQQLCRMLHAELSYVFLACVTGLLTYDTVCTIDAYAQFFRCFLC